MGFLKSPEQIAGGSVLGGDIIFNPAEVLSILYETKPEIIARILPPPLKPYNKPYAIVAFNNFKNVNFDSGINGPGYKEPALYIPAVYDDIVGTFVAGMVLNTDMGTFVGREMFGYPKKVGTVGHHFENDVYTVYVARHGIPFVTMRAKLNGVPNDPNFQQEFANAIAADSSRPGYGVNWTYKWMHGLNDKIFEHPPVLVKGWKSKKDLGIPGKIGSGEIHYIWSEDDPWAEVEVVRVLGASLVHVESRMYCDAEYIPVDEKAFLPYAFFGWDVKPGF